MLAEPAQRLERRPASSPRARAPVRLLRVRGAVQVLVQVEERRERAVAQVAFVPFPVPCARGRPPARHRLLPATDEPGAIGDDAVLVELRDDAVHHIPIDARRAPAGLEVVDEGRARDEGLVAAFHRAADLAPLVEGGALVVAERVVVPEHALARDAVLVCMDDATVLVQPGLGIVDLQSR